MAVEGEAVDHEGVAEEVEVLAGVADAVGAAEPEGVFEVAVDGFGVVAAGVEAGEVGVGGWDGPDVLGAVEPAGGVFGGAVEPDGDGLAAVGVRGAGSRCTSGTCRSCRRCDACGCGEFGEGEVAGFGEFTDADGTAARVQRERVSRPSTVMVLSSMRALFSTRRSARRGSFGLAWAAVTRLMGSRPRSRSRVW